MSESGGASYGPGKNRVPGFESLEGRVVMSRAAVPVVGALGDSYTDEYRFYPPDRSQARNWVEMLAATRKVRFGPLRAGGWGEPRNGGFAFNWARSEAGSSDVVGSQLPGLVQQVATGRIDYAWLFFGGDDFLHYAERLALSGGAASPEQVGAEVAGLTARSASNFDQAVVSLLAANPQVRLVVATVPDLTSLPLARQFANLPGANVLARIIEQGLQAYDQHIRDVAARSDRIALADLAQLNATITNSGAAAVPFDGTTLDLVNPGDGYQHLYLADGLHVGTIGQGLIADAFIEAIDNQFGARVAPLAPGQIVHYARAVAAHASRR